MWWTNAGPVSVRLRTGSHLRRTVPPHDRAQPELQAPQQPDRFLVAEAGRCRPVRARADHVADERDLGQYQAPQPVERVHRLLRPKSPLGLGQARVEVFENGEPQCGSQPFGRTGQPRPFRQSILQELSLRRLQSEFPELAHSRVSEIAFHILGREHRRPGHE